VKKVASILSPAHAQFYTKYGKWAYSYTVAPPFKIHSGDKIFIPETLENFK
jgi:hypothetical protein